MLELKLGRKIAMKTAVRFLIVVLLTSFVGILLGCEKSTGTKVEVEKLDDIKPNLPSVPTLPPPPYPTQYGDQSYSVYGLRKMIKNTINTALSVTGYIVKVYQPPPCEDETKCPPPSAPHLWLGDSPNEEDETKLLLVAGYAENQQQIDDAIAGKAPEISEGADLPPIPTDLFKGAKVKIQGRFGYSTQGFVTDRGFQSSEGLLQYVSHQLIEPGAPSAK
ncbi:MAG: hypothetical protein JXA30_11015 [Deltaproteobacteria bacterium]|nr:hypothetical protein [Deltaproteobacteria bacterium]